MDDKQRTLSSLLTRSRLTGLVTLLGAVITLGALLYASFELNSLTKEIERKREQIQQFEQEILIRERRIEELERALQVRQQRIKEIEQTIHDLQRTESDLLDFLSAVASKEQIHILDPSVDWNRVKKTIISMPAGKRKQAMLIALLYAWKDIPFTLGGKTPRSGFDSPRFLQHVLSHVGVEFKAAPNERVSNTIMRALQKVDKPLPGDLVFYKGQIGSFGFLLLDTGNAEHAPVGVGTLQEIAPLQVISLDNINTPYFPLIGYFHVQYPDE